MSAAFNSVHGSIYDYYSFFMPCTDNCYFSECLFIESSRCKCLHLNDIFVFHYFDCFLEALCGLYGKLSVHCDVRDMEFRKELESWSGLHHYTFHFAMFYLLLLFLALMLRFYLVVLYISSVFFICLFRSRRYLIYAHKLINTIHTTS